MESRKCVTRFIIILGFLWVSTSALDVSVVLGQTAKLPCSCLENRNGIAMNFTRLDHPGGPYVILVRDNHSDKTKQIPEYSKRVGWTPDWTLLIHNVTHWDEGKFICYGFYMGPESEDPGEVQSSVTLTVRGGNLTRPDTKRLQPAGGNLLSKLGQDMLIPIAVIVIIVIVVLILLYLKRRKKESREKIIDGDDGDEERCVFIKGQHPVLKNEAYAEVQKVSVHGDSS